MVSGGGSLARLDVWKVEYLGSWKRATDDREVKP